MKNNTFACARTRTRRAATTDKKAAKNWGNLVLAVDPELMGDKAEFAVRRDVSSRRSVGRDNAHQAGGRQLRGVIGRTSWTFFIFIVLFPSAETHVSIILAAVD